MDLVKLMRCFSIRMRMVGAIAVVLVLLGFLGGAGMYGMWRIQSMGEHFLRHNHKEAEILGDLRAGMHQVRQLEKDMIIQYERPEAVAQAHAQWLLSLQAVYGAAQRMLEGEEDEDNPLVRQVQQQVQDYQKGFEPVAQQLRNGAYDTATVAYKMSGPAIAAFARADEQVGRLAQTLRSESGQASAAQSAVARDIRGLFTLAVVLTLLIVVPPTLLNMKAICAPVQMARALARNIAAGDLSQEVSISGNDELTELQRALTDMQDSLRTMVAQVRDSSRNIATASEQIAAGNHDLSGRTEQTSGNVQQTVTSMSGLTQTVEHTARSAQLANELASSASQAAVRGGTVVEQAVSSMHDISSSSQRIGDIIGLIDSIAFQTNILALNAAVEAARAGVQGRGFAVVASEVRALANKTATAASEIKTLIGGSVQAIGVGVRLVEDAGSAMKEIVEGVQRVTNIIGEITSAASVQSLGIGQMNVAVGEIDQMTQQNAALVEQSAAAAESLKAQAARLADSVQGFVLDGAMPANPVGT